MTTTIAVVGATGDLGGRVTKALLERGATVRALVRPGTSSEKRKRLEEAGAKIAAVDTSKAAEITRALDGASCVVSTVQGLRNVIVDTQTALLGAAVAVGVPRFIPSDFSSDFSNLPFGENRNFDLRREFHARLDKAAIAPTSIFNGAFAELLAYNMPFLDLKAKRVGYWGAADWRVDFSTKDDTAAFTACAAMDPSTPRVLRIASFQISAMELAALASEVGGTPFELVRYGSLEELSASNRRERAAHPEGEAEVFPRWQQSQYLHSMFSCRAMSLDNARYPALTRTTARELLGALFQRD